MTYRNDGSYLRFPVEKKLGSIVRNIGIVRDKKNELQDQLAITRSQNVYEKIDE